MKHFPLFLDTTGRRILLSGGGDAAVAKLRLLLKTEGRIEVYADDPVNDILHWAAEGRITLIQRTLTPADAEGALLIYGADEDADRDAETAAIARSAGVLHNIVDNLEGSAFITPAIVDRDPVTVAIGTEGAAPVLARAIKADLEARLPARLGALARIGKAFRHMAEVLPMGRKRRDFWADYYFDAGPRAHEAEGDDGAERALDDLLGRHLDAAPRPGHVDFVGAGPGDPDLLTLKARKALDAADIVIHDRLISPEILELARREATLIDAGKEGFGPSMSQERINALIVAHAGAGAQVVRLKAGDAGIFGRLDEEIEAVEAADLSWRIVPGITSAAAAAASIGQSLTRRGRNSSLRFITGHDMEGFAEHDWRALARPGEVAAIYMGKKSARFVQGRLMMHGAAAAVPVTIIENASRIDERIIGCCLGDLPRAVTELTGPAIILYGLAPRRALTAFEDMKEARP